MKKIIIVFFLAITTMFAETIYETYNYTMGDNDSRSEARQICFLEAKRKLIEKVGVYIESNTTVKNYQLESDEIKSFSAALMKVETVSENWNQIANTFLIELKIKAEVDKNFQKDLLKLLENKRDRDKVSKQQDQIKQLEEKLDQLNRRISNSNYDQSVNLKKERNVIFEEISKTEQIMQKIQNITKQAVENVRIGMNAEEVITVAGEPRKRLSDVSGLYVGNLGYLNCFNYGDVWIVFESGFVIGCIPSQHFGYAKGNYGNNMYQVLLDFDGSKIYK